MGATIQASTAGLHNHISQVVASFCPDTFIANLRTSELCVERQYKHLDGDALAKLYGDTITGLLDKQVSVRQVTCCRMSSNVWLDDECRRAKRTFRSMEKAARRAGPLSDANSPAAVRGLSRGVST